jgi:GAF domain-containing protein
MATHALREQEALRRIAILVAQETSQAQVFEAIASEAMHLLRTDAVRIVHYEGDSGVVLAGSGQPQVTPPGFRFPLDGDTVAARIFRQGKPARQDEYNELSGSLAESVRAAGIRSVVGAPVLVEGRLWGAITTGMTREEPLPADTESRLGEFTALMATAISNAEARAEVERLAEEQAALRRVATLVAQDVPSSELFAAVAHEVGTLFGADLTTMARFDDDAATIVVASSNEALLPTGTRHDDDVSASAEVYRSGRSARVDGVDWSGVGGVAGTVAGLLGIVSTVASPILVEGKAWGALSVSSTRAPLPPDTEERLENFSDLVATAIANSESRTEVERLADEQAALRRVATLVAENPESQELFSAVAREAAAVLDVRGVIVDRFEADGSQVTLGSAYDLELEGADAFLGVGVRLPLRPGTLAAGVWETQRATRVDKYGELEGMMGDAACAAGVRSGCAAPIVVDGELWGQMCAFSGKGMELPVGMEHKLDAFVKLVATAISNYDARANLRTLADEQAALRRVATLVAESAPSAELFSAVTREVAHVFSDVDPEVVASVIRFDPGPEGVLVGASREYEQEPLGSRWTPKELYVSTHVLRTQRSARVGEAGLDAIGGPDADVLRLRGFLYQVGSPVMVEGKLWGAMCLNSNRELPPDTEERLENFTELIATAIANAESQEARAVLTEEQAALRRVATLVARDAASTEVFEAVATEVGKLLDTDITVVGRYDSDGYATAIGSWSASSEGVPVGTRSAIGGHNVLTIVAETGEPARVDDYAEATGDAADIARRYGWRSSIAAPIVVEDRLWGVMLVATRRPEPFPAGAEERLAAFTDLVSTAVANTEARHALERAAAEQAALRRVATLVAQGASPQDLFDAVAEEVGRLLLAANVSMGRYEPEGDITSMASWSFAGPIFTPGIRWPIKGTNVAWIVLQTGKPARIDDFSAATDPIGVAVWEAGYRAAIGSPIVVEGHLWGVISAASTEGPMPPGSEARLASFTELVATAIANAESKSALNASRRRIVTASDETRRRIERDLHDGTQQRLVSLGLALRAAEATVPPDRPDLQADLSQIAAGLAGAVEDLQELSRGIHPAILSRGGLVPALRTLARRSATPVELDVSTDVHVPEPIEVAAYFVASEALANATKHAEASHIQLSLAQFEGVLLLAIRDDGVGGADPAQGSGLVGLADRVEALGGSIDIESRPGDGTQIIARIPSELEAETSSEQDL